MITTIIFDFGGVVLKHKTSLMEDKIAKMFSLSTEKATKVWEHEKPPLLVGKINTREFLAKLKKDLHSNIPIQKLLKLWGDIYAKEAKNVNWELLDFIEKLKGKYKVYLFTDTIDTHDQYNRGRGIYEKFDRVFKSFEEGVAKANGKEAFTHILRKIGVDPSEVIFVDDMEKNIRIAEDIGIRGILFTDFQKLKSSFISSGIVL